MTNPTNTESGISVVVDRVWVTMHRLWLRSRLWLAGELIMLICRIHMTWSCEWQVMMCLHLAHSILKCRIEHLRQELLGGFIVLISCDAKIKEVRDRILNCWRQGTPMSASQSNVIVPSLMLRAED